MNEWTAVILSKPWNLAKQRLASPHRAQLARAFCLDVIDAVRGTDRIGRVLVVSAEPALLAMSASGEFAVLPDRPLHPFGGLASAVNVGRQWAQRQAPTSPVVMIPADLPCLTAPHLGMTLDALGDSRNAYVPDWRGDGTTLLSSTMPSRLVASYGPNSSQKHEKLGLERAAEDCLAARLDVDTIPDLHRALELGSGRHTLTALVRASVGTRN